MLLLSEGKAGEAWKLSIKARIFRICGSISVKRYNEILERFDFHGTQEILAFLTFISPTNFLLSYFSTHVRLLLSQPVFTLSAFQFLNP